MPVTITENYCQTLFASGKQYWHAYTSGKDTPIIFTTDLDFIFAMNVIAQSSSQLGGKVVILAFEVMNNHFHFVMLGEQDDLLSFFDFIKKRLARAFPLMKTLTLSLKPIQDLKALRNNIVYVNRNGYVANPDCTPFSYRWGTGPYYFNNFPFDGLMEEKSIPDLRQMFRGRATEIPADWKHYNGYITPDSYCNISLGMRMFKDAHQYFSMVSKNVEAYAELATELNDSEFMTDSELFPFVLKIARDEYGVLLIKDLSPAQKLDLARQVRKKFRSSNGQIRRVLGLTQFDVDNLFPLTK